MSYCIASSQAKHFNHKPPSPIPPPIQTHIYIRFKHIHAIPQSPPYTHILVKASSRVSVYTVKPSKPRTRALSWIQQCGCNRQHRLRNRGSLGEYTANYD